MPGDRTEQATPQRREKARKDGDLLHSREFTSAAGTLAGVIALGWFGGRAMKAWRSGYAAFLDLGSPARWETSQLEPTLSAIRRLSVTILAPVGIVMAGVASAALFAGILQTGGGTDQRRGLWLPCRSRQSALEYQEPVFSPGSRASGKVSDSCGTADCFRSTEDCARTVCPAVFGGAS